MSTHLADFPPTRAAGLARLDAFAARAGRDYAAGRNSDLGLHAGAVSRLSRYLRYRMITDAEVVAAALAAHGPEAADKYVSEVLWRTYWKGWLEMRPSVWTRFAQERDDRRARFPNARALAAAEGGATGIDGFDDWARELVATGYLHNHARMWFASIWIFTLRLPWTLGADFFLRHLIDADAASNTLSWRWVAGLQTVGKTYLATADNIARHTGGRFAPKGLAREGVALSEAPIPAPIPPARREPPASDARSLLLVTSDDMHPESIAMPPVVAAVVADGGELWGDKARAFVAGAADDARARVAAHMGGPARVTALDADALVAAAREAGATQIVTADTPVGPVAYALTAIEPLLAGEGLRLARVRRGWDERFWPGARKGFFAFKETIPSTLRDLGMA